MTIYRNNDEQRILGKIYRQEDLPETDNAVYSSKDGTYTIHDENGKVTEKYLPLYDRHEVLLGWTLESDEDGETV